MIRKLFAPLAVALSFTVFGVPIVPLLGVGVVIPLTQTACPKPDKDTIVSWGNKAVDGLEKAKPMLVNAGINPTQIDGAITIGRRFLAAAEANDSSSTVGLASSFISAFEGVVADTERITNPTTRTIILVVLTVVNAALHKIADELAKQEPNLPAGMRGAPPVMKIRQFKAKKQWRCRNSQTGQYATMKFCEQHPDISQVETKRN